MAIRAILTDIEGTTSSISFVKDVLFPYSREHMAEFVAANGHKPEVRALLEETCGMEGHALDQDWAVQKLIQWIDEDRKAPPLKAIQGLIWEDGYNKGNFTGHLYEDAYRGLKRWNEQGIKLYVFSSGSVQAQKLLFGHTKWGDLTPWFSGHFDTRTGAKQESASYRAIAEQIGLPAEEILFLSDVEAELKAASEAGMQTKLLARDEKSLPKDAAANFDVINLTPSITVNLSGNYPIYKDVNGELVLITTRNPGRRYSLTTNVQSGLTYYREFTDKEEKQADKQKADWDASAPQREAEAARAAEEARKFEESLHYKHRIVAFIDILGWKDAIEGKTRNDEAAVKALGKVLAQLQGITRFTNSLHTVMQDNLRFPGDPIMTQFSDSLVLSVNDDEHGRQRIQDTLYSLTSSLIEFNFLLRGGVVRGELFHQDNLVFGPAFNKAYELESKVALFPRIILSEELSNEWADKPWDGSMPWKRSSDGYLFFNFLPPFMGREFFADDQEFWQSRLRPVRELILSKANDKKCSESVFSKYLWLASYFDNVCEEFPNCGVKKVLKEAVRLREKECL